MEWVYTSLIKSRITLSTSRIERVNTFGERDKQVFWQYSNSHDQGQLPTTSEKQTFIHDNINSVQILLKFLENLADCSLTGHV